MNRLCELAEQAKQSRQFYYLLFTPNRLCEATLVAEATSSKSSLRDCASSRSNLDNLVTLLHNKNRDYDSVISKLH